MTVNKLCSEQTLRCLRCESVTRKDSKTSDKPGHGSLPKAPQTTRVDHAWFANNRTEYTREVRNDTVVILTAVK